jgi:hypothetical protein
MLHVTSGTLLFAESIRLEAHIECFPKVPSEMVYMRIHVCIINRIGHLLLDYLTIQKMSKLLESLL